MIALLSVVLLTACRGDGEETGRVKNDAPDSSLRPSDQRFEPTWSGRRSPGSDPPVETKPGR